MPDRNLFAYVIGVSQIDDEHRSLFAAAARSLFAPALGEERS